ncbi:hypothetical protein QQ045_015642 [Rhodiola kirilowii]
MNFNTQPELIRLPYEDTKIRRDTREKVGAEKFNNFFQVLKEEWVQWMENDLHNIKEGAENTKNATKLPADDENASSSQRNGWTDRKERSNIRFQAQRQKEGRTLPNGRGGWSGNLQRFRERFVSLFVNNIPEGRNSSWLRSTFSQVGKVVDVFIPINKRSNTGSRFGFVRYQSLIEAENAINRWNGLEVGGKKLAVKLEGLSKDSKPSEEMEDQPHKNHPHKIWRAKVIHEENPEKESKKASEANRNKDPAGMKKVEIQAVEENKSWLRRCAVGKTRNMEFCGNLKRN